MSQDSSTHFLPLEKTSVHASYSNLSKDLSVQKDRVYVTGGSLILALAQTLGFSSSEFNSDKQINVAGKDFSVRGLWLIWKFYTVLSFHTYTFGCVDERLLPDTSDSGIHEHCGACAACTVLLGKNSGDEVEDFALQALGKNKKQEIISEIKDEHVSTGILISCGDLTYALSENAKNERLHGVGDLPFHVSFPTAKIELFAQNLSEEDKNLFLKTLIDWNCGIVLRIIAGGHNLRSQELHNVGVHVTLVDAMENDKLIQNLIDGINENLSEIFLQNVPELDLIKENKAI